MSNFVVSAALLILSHKHTNIVLYWTEILLSLLSTEKK